MMAEAATGGRWSAASGCDWLPRLVAGLSHQWSRLVVATSG